MSYTQNSTQGNFSKEKRRNIVNYHKIKPYIFLGKLYV